MEDSLSREQVREELENLCPESTRWEVEMGQQDEVYVIKSQKKTHFILRHKKPLKGGVLARQWEAWRGRLKGVGLDAFYNINQWGNGRRN